MKSVIICDMEGVIQNLNKGAEETAQRGEGVMGTQDGSNKVFKVEET